METGHSAPPVSPRSWLERQWERVERASGWLTTVKNLVTAIGVIGGTVVSLGAVAGQVYPAAQARLFALFDIQQRSWEDIGDQPGPFDPSCSHRMVFLGETPQEGPGGIKLIKGTRVEPVLVSGDILFVPWNPENRMAISAEKKNVFLFNDNRHDGSVERRC